MTNYELLRWLVETLSCDIHHYWMLNMSAVDRAILQISHGHVTVRYLQYRTVDRRYVQHSIIMNVTWQRFDQSAKQLIAGHTTRENVVGYSEWRALCCGAVWRRALNRVKWHDPLYCGVYCGVLRRKWATWRAASRCATSRCERTLTGAFGAGQAAASVVDLDRVEWVAATRTRGWRAPTTDRVRRSSLTDACVRSVCT